MTQAQLAVIEWLEAHEYAPVVIQRRNYGVLTVAICRRLRRGIILLRLGPEGVFIDTSYETRFAQI